MATPEPAYEWVGDTLRHVGTVLHRMMQRMAEEGPAEWHPARIEGLRPAIHAMLKNLAVPPVELGSAVKSVESALVKTLQDERGRWILQAHAEAASEYEVTGVVEGKVLRAKVDRTFVDEQGVRWIIDYKTSAHQGGDLETFLENEQMRYRQQLDRYARLMAQMEERPTRLALYFPLLNSWKEWPAETIKRRQASLFES